MTNSNRVELPLVHRWEGPMPKLAAEEQRDADQLVVNDLVAKLAASEKERASLYNEENIKVQNLGARLAEVRRRAISDFYTGTSLDACHQAFCMICEWGWPYDEKEGHEPTCPLREERP